MPPPAPGSRPPRTRRRTPRGSPGRARPAAATRGRSARLPSRSRTTVLAIAPKAATPTALPDRAGEQGRTGRDAAAVPADGRLGGDDRRAGDVPEAEAHDEVRRREVQHRARSASTVSSSAAPARAMTEPSSIVDAEPEPQVEPPRRRRRDRPPDGHRREGEAGDDRPGAEHALGEQRHVRREPEQQHADDERGGHRGPDDPVPEHPQRQHRLGGPPLDEHEGHEHDAPTPTSSPMLTGEAHVPHAPRPRAGPRAGPPCPRAGAPCRARRPWAAARSGSRAVRLLVEPAPQHPARRAAPSGRLTRKIQRHDA